MLLFYYTVIMFDLFSSKQAFCIRQSQSMFSALLGMNLFYFIPFMSYLVIKQSIAKLSSVRYAKFDWNST